MYRMDDGTIQDLKQFISATIEQQVSELRADIKALDDKLSLKIDDLSNSVAEAIENTSEAAEALLHEHENRIVRLERKIA